jgi:hypothetical protein
MDEADFTDFVTHRAASLLRTAFLLCGGDRPAAEDLLQDVLERAYPRWRRIKGKPEPYLRARERGRQSLAQLITTGERGGPRRRFGGHPAESRTTDRR